MKICDGLWLPRSAWLATESLERRATDFDLLKESAEAIVAKRLPACTYSGRFGQVKEIISKGRRIGIDCDLSKFFDKVSHDILMNRLATLSVALQDESKIKES